MYLTSYLKACPNDNDIFQYITICLDASRACDGGLSTVMIGYSVFQCAKERNLKRVDLTGMAV